MHDLFELVRLLSVRRQFTRSGTVEITRFAWRENGESNLLALFCSNDQLLLRLGTAGRTPVIKQMPWTPEKRIVSMCFDPTVAWLMIVTDCPNIFILPVLAHLDPSVCLNQLWSTSDCTRISVAVEGVLCAACWWHTLDDRQIAILATKAGVLLFIDLLSQKVVSKVRTDLQLSDLSLIQDDCQISTSLLMSGVSNGQWTLLLEARTQSVSFSPGSDELRDVGYINSPHSVLDCTDENAGVFKTEGINTSQPSTLFAAQYARGRHFVTAHDQKLATLQVYDSEVDHCPLFVYKLPLGVDHVILMDRLTFAMSHRHGCSVLVLSNQKAETSMETQQDFNEDAIVQQLKLPLGERFLGCCRRTFPFYWHDKQEEQQLGRLQQGTVLDQPSMEMVAMEPHAFAIPLSTHTVLDGCILITDTAVYECRPRASPERLFLQHAIVTSDLSVAEHLAISVGLDLTYLAELAADFLLKTGQYSRAIRLYSLAKCSYVKRCAKLALFGRLQEISILSKQALHSTTGLELHTKDRKFLADLLLYCFMHTLTPQHSASQSQLLTSFRDFLMGSFSLAEDVVLDLLSEHGCLEDLLHFAMARGLVVEALERILTFGQLPIPIMYVMQLVSRGFSAHVLQTDHGAVMSSLSAESLVNVLVSKPELICRHVMQIKPLLPLLNMTMLLHLAASLDPSTGLVQSQLRRLNTFRHRASSLTSLTSLTSNPDVPDSPQETHVCSLYLILEVFVLTVLHINHHRRCYAGAETEESFEELLTDPALEHHLPRERQHTQEGSRFLDLQFHPADCGTCHAAVIRDGDLYTWGKTQHGRLGHGHLVREGAFALPARVETFHLLQIGVEAVSCGGQHTLAITQQGVYGWGNSQYGQVGVNTRHAYHRPMLVESLLAQTCVALSCGQYHSLALTTEAKVYSWGWGVHGQLGHGDPNDQLLPKCIEALTGHLVVRIGAGYCHSLVLTEVGEVWSFGCGYFGQLGHGNSNKQTYPSRVTRLTEAVTIIATKYFHCVAVDICNRVFTWGCHPHNLKYSASVMRRSRQHGKSTGDEMDMFHLPIQIDTTFIRSTIVQVSCGSLHSMLLTQDGEVYVWGRNLEGQLGTGSRQDERAPKMLTRINDQHMIYLCSGGEYNLAMDSDFSLWAWGKADGGQLGMVKTHRSRPTDPLKAASAVLVQDVIIPTPHRGLPPVNIHSQGHWFLDNPETPSPSVNLNVWMDGEQESTEEQYALPCLDKNDVPFCSHVVPLVVQVLENLVDPSTILQYCVDLQDWLTAAQICLLNGRTTQALGFRLMFLQHKASLMDSSRLTHLSSKVALFHIMQALDNNTSMDMTNICLQVVDHWLQHSLPISYLQKLLEPHLPQLAPYLAKVLFRLESHISRDSHLYCSHFHPSFCVSLLSQLQDYSPLTEQLLTSWASDLSPLLWTGQLSQQVADQAKCSKLQFVERLIPFQRLWQDIVRNISKSSQTSATTILLTRSQLDHLFTLSVEKEEEKSTQEIHAGGSSVVLFTCGHHFTSRAFCNILQSMLHPFHPGSENKTTLGLSKLPFSAALLQQLYSQEHLLPLACPKCVASFMTQSMERLD